MSNWDDLKCLMHLARNQTMTNAASALKTNVSTISRRLERLNSSLAEPALVKFGNGWKLTSYGEKLAEASTHFQIALNQVETEALNGQNTKQVSRKITLSAPHVLVSAYLSGFFAGFADLHPGIELNIVAENKHERTADGAVDLALHLERPSKGRLMCRKVGAIHTGIFAKKSTHPTKWIGLDHSMDNWPEMELAKQIFKSEPELRINTLDGIKSAVEQTGWAGLGIDALYPEHQGWKAIHSHASCASEGEAKILSGLKSGYAREVWLVYHETRRHDAALRYVCDWIIQVFQQTQLKQNGAGLPSQEHCV